MAIGTGTIIGDTALRLGRDRDHQFERRKPMRLPEQPAAIPPRRQTASALGGRIASVTASLALIVTLVLWLASTGANWFAGENLSDDETPVEVVIGDDVLLVPGNAIRFDRQRRGGTLPRLDLQLKWPELSGFRPGDETIFRSNRAQIQLLFVSLEPRSMRLDMSGRLEPIYSRFLEGVPVDAGHGLLRRPLPASKGFVEEDLYYEAASPYPYVARCIRAGSAMAAPYCLRDIHVGRSLALSYRFHISLIDEWMTIEAAIRARAHEMLGD